MKKVFALMIFAALSGCEPTPDSIQRNNAESISYKTNERFKVERVGVFADGLAYGSKRGIYIITDKETNQEFVGVSGVGISEVASHQTGKVQSSDER